MVDKTPSAKPELVYSNNYNVAVKVTSGDNHVMILTEKGDVYTFGKHELIDKHLHVRTIKTLKLILKKLLLTNKFGTDLKSSQKDRRSE